MSGSNAIIVIDDSVDIVEALGNFLFLRARGCSRCTAVPRGFALMARRSSVCAVAKHAGRCGLSSTSPNIQGRTICAFGEACAWPVLSFVEKFRDDFEERRRGRGPLGQAAKRRKRQTSMAAKETKPAVETVTVKVDGVPSRFHMTPSWRENRADHRVEPANKTASNPPLLLSPRCRSPATPHVPRARRGLGRPGGWQAADERGRRNQGVPDATALRRRPRA